MSIKKKETYFISLSKSLHQINNLVFSNLWMEKHCYGILFVINILYFANPSIIIMFRAGIFILPVCPYTPPSRTLLECLVPDDNIWYLCSSMWKPTDFLFLTSLAAWKAIVMLGSEGELWLSPAARTGRSSQVGRDERRMRWGVRCLSSGLHISVSQTPRYSWLSGKFSSSHNRLGVVVTSFLISIDWVIIE